MNNPLAFPETTLVNRLVAKDRFYQQDHSLREWLTREVESITWLYKLTPQTLHVAPSVGLEEVDIFLLTFKPEGHDTKPIPRLAQLIPRPTLFLQNSQLSILNSQLPGLTMEAIYYGLRSQLEGLDARSAEDYEAQSARRRELEGLRKKADSLRRALKKERSFPRQQELAAQLRQVNSQISTLHQASSSASSPPPTRH